jgi:hypothetical protein
MSFVNFRKLSARMVAVPISHQTVFPVENCKIIQADGSGIIGVLVHDEKKPFTLGASEVVAGEHHSRETEHFRMKYMIDPDSGEAVKYELH